MTARPKKALILGCEGQDGYFLKRLLLSKEYIICGTVKNSHRKTLSESLPGLNIEVLDIADTSKFVKIFEEFQPDEVYNLAGMSSVGKSFLLPDLCMETNYLSVQRILMYLRNKNSAVKFYQSSSSEIFGNRTSSADENASLNPISPYGVSKSLTHELCKKLREEFGLYVSTGILFNHESEIRSTDFVSRKITMSVAAIKKGEISKFTLGNISISRDWGYARDYVRAMHMILEAPIPGDFVVATGVSHTLEEFIVTALRIAGLGTKFHDYVQLDEDLMRSSDLLASVGNASKISRELGWHPEVSFERMIEIMYNHDFVTSGPEIS
jgi:GDPmannose 4,6-dehydratase